MIKVIGVRLMKRLSKKIRIEHLPIPPGDTVQWSTDGVNIIIQNRGTATVYGLNYFTKI